MKNNINILIKILLNVFIMINYINISYAKNIYIKNINIDGLIYNKNYKNELYNNIFKYNNNYINKKDIRNIIKKIFKTGLFSNIFIKIKDNTLYIKLEERKFIKNINIKGNKIISDKFIRKILNKYNLLSNNIINENNIFKFKLYIINEYNNLGKFKVKLDFNLEDINNTNYVNIFLNINEGIYSEIDQINIFGNNSFKKIEILNKLNFNKKFFFIKNKYIYKKNFFIKKLNELQKFYIDNGYINFKIDKLDIKFSKDMSKVYINIYLNEGNIYYIENFKINSNLNEKYIEYIKKNIDLNIGDVCKCYKIIKIKNNIKKILLKKFNIDSDININFKFNENNKKSLIINFNIFIKKKQEINKILLKGIKYTSSSMIKNELKKICLSKIYLKNIYKYINSIKKFGYFENIFVNLLKLKYYDKFNLIINLKESKFNILKLSSDLGNNKFNLYLDFDQINWLGTGGHFSIKTIYNKPEYNLIFNIENPYFTIRNLKNGCKFFKKFKYKNINNFSKLTGISNYLYIPLKYNKYIKLETVFYNKKFRKIFLNKSLNNLINKKKFYINSNILKYIRNNIYIESNNIDILTKFNFNTLNNLYIPTKGINIKINTENCIYIPLLNNFDKFYFKLDKYTNFNKFKKIIFNNKIYIMYLKYLKKNNLYDYEDINNDIFMIRGFNNINNNFDFKKINKFRKKLNHKKIDIKLTLINEIIFPIKFNNKKLNNISQLYIFLDNNVNLNIKKNIFFKKNIRLSTGIGLKVLSPIGLLKLNYSIPLIKNKLDKLERFQSDLLSIE